MILYFVNFSVNILFSIWTVILSAMSTTFLSSSLYFLCFFIFPYFFSVSVEKNIIIFLAYLEVDYIDRFFFSFQLWTKLNSGIFTSWSQCIFFHALLHSVANILFRILSYMFMSDFDLYYFSSFKVFLSGFDIKIILDDNFLPFPPLWCGRCFVEFKFSNPWMFGKSYLQKFGPFIFIIGFLKNTTLILQYLTELFSFFCFSLNIVNALYFF